MQVNYANPPEMTHVLYIATEPNARGGLANCTISAKTGIVTRRFKHVKQNWSDLIKNYLTNISADFPGINLRFTDWPTIKLDNK